MKACIMMKIYTTALSTQIKSEVMELDFGSIHMTIIKNCLEVYYQLIILLEIEGTNLFFNTSTPMVEYLET